MFIIQDMVQPNSLEEAYKLLVSRRNNTVLGGCAFLRLGSKRIGTAIDLSSLDLAYIKEDGGYLEIGAMTTLREIETSPLLKESFNAVLPQAVSHIVGVQFRNLATVGASVFSKYGFSDLITALLALNTTVELYKGGRMSLSEFLAKPYEKDILTRIFIKKEARQAAYESLRKSAADFPILTVAVSRWENNWTIVVGARPQVAQIAQQASELLSQSIVSAEDIEKAAKLAAEELSFGTNARGSAEYRQAMCQVLVKRAVTEVLTCK